MLLGELLLILAVAAVRASTAAAYALRLQKSIGILAVALLGALPHLVPSALSPETRACSELLPPPPTQGLFFAYLGVIGAWARIADVAYRLR